MDIQIISVRISQCIDDLSLLLDLLYKFPQKQRQSYFEKIQSLKNKLLILKSNLREANAVNVEKQYKQIYLSMNSLKNQITQQSNAISAAKENRDAQNRGKDIKQAKRNYEDAMKLIVERDEEISVLRSQLYQKEQLIRINFQELNTLRKDFELVLEDNRRLKFEYTSLQIDLQTSKASIGRTSDITIEYKIRQQEKDKVFHSALDELERLKGELIEANQKINHFEQLAEMSLKKTKMVQENIKKVEREAQDINENYRAKQHENFKKLRQFGQLQFEINNKGEQIKQLQLQNKRLRQDLQVLQNEIKKYSKSNTQQRLIFSEQKQKLCYQLKLLNIEIQNGLVRESELKHIIEESQKKYLIVINRLNESEELKLKYNEMEVKNESLNGKLNRLQDSLQNIKRQNAILVRQKQKVIQQTNNQMRSTREIEIQNFKFKEKLKLKDQQRMRLVQELEMYQRKLRQSQKALAFHQVSFQALESQVVEEKTKIIKWEQKNRIRDKQIQNLKIRLLKAKIQTIHEIREVIN